MAVLLYIAAFSAFFVGAAHSYLGEQRIIKPLLEHGNLPSVRGSQKNTAAIIRVAWHITTILYWVFGVLFVLMARDALNLQNVAVVFACTFLPLGLHSLVASRGKHISWLPFLTIGGVSLYTALVS